MDRQVQDKQIQQLLESNPHMDVEDVRDMCAAATMFILRNRMITLEDLSNRLSINLLTAERIHRLVLTVMQGNIH